MIPDLGNLLLYIALCLSILSASAPIISKSISLKIYRAISLLIFLCIISSFLSLIYCYITSDFSVLNVANNSHINKPLIYKISGAWGNHEGSMLLWLSAMSLFIVGFLLENNSHALSKLTFSVHSALMIFFLSFTIFFSNPFVRIFPSPANGLGLNPILQDIGLAFHPPILYLGYVGFSVGYSITIAFLFLSSNNSAEKNINNQYVGSLKKWVLIPWFFLTIGIALGSWWAYRELGWGGFWFWDPVENASLMPWLSSTALLHAVAIYKKTGAMKLWVIVLSLSTFILSVLGTFLVRSGIVTSVHSFATDPDRGILILTFLGLIALFSMLVFIFKYKSGVFQDRPASLLSRITFININNLFLSVALFTVLLGTIFPMILELLDGTKISVGAPYFNSVFNPIMIALSGFCAIGSGISWRGSKKNRIGYLSLGLALITAAIFSYINKINGIIEICGLGMGLWLCFSTIALYYKNIFQNAAYSRSMLLAHLGFGLIILSVALNASLNQEIRSKIKIGEIINFMDYKIKLGNVVYEKRSNHIAQVALIELEGLSIYLKPEIQFFDIEQQQTIESSIYRTGFADLYIVTDNIYDDNGISIQVHYKPMMSFLWFGCFLLAIAALHSIVNAMRGKSYGEFQKQETR